MVFGIGANTLAVINANTAERSREDLAEAYADVSDASFDYGSAVQSCAARQAGFGCLREAANELRAAFVTFESRLGGIKMPGGALAAADELDADADEIIDALGRMAETEDPNEYDAAVQRLQQVGQEFDTHVQELDDSLAFSS